jgi:hypothetical protein
LCFDILSVRKGRDAMMKVDSDILEMALVGYVAERTRIEAKIAQIQADLKGGVKRSAAPSATAEAKPKRKMSAKARKAIADAQKKRWESFRAAKQAKKPKSGRKRTLSSSAKANLAANLQKARAAKAAQKAAVEQTGAAAQ